MIWKSIWDDWMTRRQKMMFVMKTKMLFCSFVLLRRKWVHRMSGRSKDDLFSSLVLFFGSDFVSFAIVARDDQFDQIFVFPSIPVTDWFNQRFNHWVAFFPDDLFAFCLPTFWSIEWLLVCTLWSDPFVYLMVQYLMWSFDCLFTSRWSIDDSLVDCGDNPIEFRYKMARPPIQSADFLRLFFCLFVFFYSSAEMQRKTSGSGEIVN